MEVKVKQRSPEWFELRQAVCLTSSNFGEAIGVGHGRPYDYFLSLISDDPVYAPDEDNSALKHGVRMETVISEAYELLTTNKIRESGFWLPSDDNLLQGKVGTSPDAVVVEKNNECDRPSDIGLCEFKAPVYRMYRSSTGVHGIPRHYMAQVQGQLAITKMEWCDFMAICTKTREIMLKRIFFQPLYWLHVSKLLEEFCKTVKDSRLRKCKGFDPLNSESVRNLKSQTMKKALFPGENIIVAKDLIRYEGNYIYGASSLPMNFDFLMGYDPLSCSREF